MKVIVNFGEKKVVVPCGIDGDISIRELIQLATAKFCKLSYNTHSMLNSEQVQLRLNNGAVVDPDDRVCDVVDDREELLAMIDHQSSIYHHHHHHRPSHTTTINSNGELSSSITSSNLSSSLSETIPHSHSQHQHEVIVTDADLRSRSLRVKNDPNFTSMIHRATYSPPTHDTTKKSLDGMFNIEIDEKTGEKTFSIILPKENSPLGIHVIPSNEHEEQVNGLILQNIEADGRVQRQGILQINDRIIEINRTNIERCSFDKAQFIFRTALIEPELELRIVRKNSSNTMQMKTRTTLAEINPNHELNFADHDPNMHSLNTRRLGKIIKISLIKGNDGLGFKLASRDNPTGVANPIYVKTIFPKGAAIEDGRLQRGDRLLMVNSIDITQMSLQETVSLLRDTRVGETVELCISRQREGTHAQDLVNDGMQVIDSPTGNESKAQMMTFDIPLNDTSSAGLGITLKGKTSIVDGQSIDLGIFVKSILTGGAASRDNRLRPNDQLLVINDSSLVNLSNAEAAAILHEAVRHEIHPGHIKVTISRLPFTNDDHHRHVKEIDLSPTIFSHPINNDENELDLTTFVPPPLVAKPPTQRSNRHSSETRANKHSSPSRNEQRTPDEIETNPFDRETTFRQSVSEKRRLTHQPNKQAIEWKQRSFHDSRSQNNRKSYPMSTTASIEILTPVIDLSDDDDDDDDDIDQTDIECRYSVTRQSEIPIRTLPDENYSSSGLVRSSSFESIHTSNEINQISSAVNEEERKRQAKLRSRACNDSFRQAVDKSYGQTTPIDDEEINVNEKNRSEKQKFRFANLFTTKSKRKDNPEDNRSVKSIVIQNPNSTQDNRPTYYPPPPPPAFTSRQNSTSSKTSKNDRPAPVYSYSVSTHEQQGYQPHRFDCSYDQYSSTHYESPLIPTFQPRTLPSKSSMSIVHPKPSHASIPRQFLQSNLSGSQSLRQHSTFSHSSILPPYPSTFTVQPSHFTSYSHNFDQPIHSTQQQQQQQTRRTPGYSGTSGYPPTRNYFHLENPANV